MVIECSDLQQRTWDRREIGSKEDLQTILQGARPRRWLLRRVLGWLMGCGRLREYSLAVRLGLETGDGGRDDEA